MKPTNTPEGKIRQINCMVCGTTLTCEVDKYAPNEAVREAEKQLVEKAKSHCGHYHPKSGKWIPKSILINPMKPSAEKNYSLRDNPDGTCNCRPLLGGCFFTDGFDGRCDCKCHQAKPAENWEKEFDNEVDRLIARSMRDPSSKPLTKIKSFIRTLLARSLEEQRVRIERFCKENKQSKPKQKCINAENHLFGSCFACVKIDGYNQALEEVLQIIQNMK